MTDRLGFYIWPAIALLAGCALTRPAEMAVLTQPPESLTGEVVTMVDWRTPEAVALKCAQVRASFGKLPLGGLGCTYAPPGGQITLVLPMDLHPLITHELGHAHQLRQGMAPDHKGWK